MDRPSPHRPPWVGAAVFGAAVLAFFYVLLWTTAAAQPPAQLPSLAREVAGGEGPGAFLSGLIRSILVGGLASVLVLWTYVSASRLSKSGRR